MKPRGYFKEQPYDAPRPTPGALITAIMITLAIGLADDLDELEGAIEENRHAFTYCSAEERAAIDAAFAARLPIAVAGELAELPNRRELVRWGEELKPTIARLAAEHRAIVTELWLARRDELREKEGAA